MSRAVVVGGGIAGLLAALQLSRFFAETVLIEQSEQIGGLLRSWQSPEGHWFDFGTHIPGYTGVDGLDALLYGDLDRSDWREFDRLVTGNYFAGRYNRDNQFINTTSLPREVHALGLAELLAMRPPAQAPRTLAEELLTAYGATYTDRIFRPLMRRFYNAPLEELAPGAHYAFGHGRLIVADAETSRELKRSPLYDRKLSYVSYDEAPAIVRYLYPRHGGVGQLVDRIRRTLETAGVSIRTQAKLARIGLAGSRVRFLELNDGETVKLDHMVWTVPPITLLRAAGVNVVSSPPAFVPMSLHHLVFDAPPKVDNHFFNCNDPDMLSFRGTLYSNLRQTPTDATAHAITLEAVDHQKRPVEEVGAAIVREVAQMGLFGKARLLCQHSLPVPAGFPVLTTGLIEAVAAQRETARAMASNLSLLGKASGANFYMRDVLVETYRHIEERFGGL